MAMTSCPQGVPSHPAILTAMAGDEETCFATYVWTRDRSLRLRRTRPLAPGEEHVAIVQDGRTLRFRDYVHALGWIEWREGTSRLLPFAA